MKKKDNSGKDQTLITWVAPLIAERVRDRVFKAASELDASTKLGKNTSTFADEIGSIVEGIDAVMEGRTLPVGKGIKEPLASGAPVALPGA